MARCKWCNTEIGDNKICPQCKANQLGEITGENIKYISPFERYEKNGSPDRSNYRDYHNATNNSQGNNKIASAINMVSKIILIVGGISSFIIILNNAFIGFIYLICCVITAIFCFGFAEIIQLLEDIKNKL